jgi:hypothetical protein
MLINPTNTTSRLETREDLAQALVGPLSPLARSYPQGEMRVALGDTTGMKPGLSAHCQISLPSP